MTKKILAILFFLFVPFVCSAQDTKDIPTKSVSLVEWVRVQGDTGEFSIEMPSNFVYFYDKDGFSHDDRGNSFLFSNMQMLNAASEKTVMSVEIYKVGAPKKYLNELVDRQRSKGSESDLSKPGFTVKQFDQDKLVQYRTGKETEISFITRFIASKSYLYVVTAASRGAQSEASIRFLSSIHLNEADSEVVKLSSLTPVTLDQVIDTEKKETKEKTVGTQKPVVEEEKPIIVLSKYHAPYTEAARNERTSGSITLRLTFNKDGRISKIAVLKGLPNGLTRNAVFAALRIKFLPLEKENELKTSTKTVVYSFSIG